MTAPGPADQAGTLVLRDGAIVYASEGVATLLARSPADIIGRPFIEFIVPEQREAARDRYARRLRGEPVPADWELAVEHPGGGRRLLEVHAVRDGGDVLVHLRDLSLRDARRLRLDAVAALGAALQRELAEDAVHARVREGFAALGLCSALMRVEDAGVRIVWAEIPPALAVPFEAITGAPFEGFFGRRTEFALRVAREGYAFSDDWPHDCALFVPDPLVPRVREAVGAAGTARAIAVRLDGRTDATFALVVAGDWLRPDDGPAVRLFGNQLAAAMDAARTVADLSRRNAQLAVLNRVGHAVAGSLELGEVLREAAGGARLLVRTSRAYVLLYDAARDELRFGEGAGVDAPALRDLHAAVAPGTAIERVIRERRFVAVDDVERSEAGPLHPGAGARAFAAVPVLLRGETLGVLVADEQSAPRSFTAADVERLSAVADRLAVAIENARLYLETRRRAEELGLVHEVGRSLVETLEIEQVLGAGVRNLARMVDATDAYLALANEDLTALEVRAVSRSDERSIGQHPAAAPARPAPVEGRAGPTARGSTGSPRAAFAMRLPLAPAEDNLAASVFATREPLVVEDALADARVQGNLRAVTAGRAYLALPLVVRDQAIGAVIIVDTRGPRLFTPAEVERAAAIANQLAVAAENARLYEDLRRSYAQLARAQQQLVQRERLAALGELSAVVAHEVRNPLGVIFNSLGSLRRLVRPWGDAKVLFDIVEEEAERLNRIVGDLLDFARPSAPELRPEQLERVVEDAVSVALGQQGNGIELVRDLDPTVPAVMIDARLVRQAVLNIAVNAVQAMARGGRLTIRTRREDGRALLEIEDTGAGIPDEVRERIFEPFFTTKASGTGLGLAVVKRIMEEHGGAVSVRSAPGAGTVFALRFPTGGPPVENGAAMGSDPAPWLERAP